MVLLPRCWVFPQLAFPCAVQAGLYQEDSVLYQQSYLWALTQSLLECWLAELRAGRVSVFLIRDAAALAACLDCHREAPAALEVSSLPELRQQAPIFRPQPTRCHGEMRR